MALVLLVMTVLVGIILIFFFFAVFFVYFSSSQYGYCGTTVAYCGPTCLCDCWDGETPCEDTVQ